MDQLDPGHAFCVLAHDDLSMFQRLSARLGEVGPVIAHIDKKAWSPSWAHQNPDVRFVRDPIDVWWGDWTVVEATILLIKEALLDESVRRVTLISGSHYPLISLAELAERGKMPINVIAARPAPNQPDGSRPDAEYRARFVRTRRPGSMTHKLLHAIWNKIVHAGRPLQWERYVDPSIMRAGSQWWSVDRSTAEYFVRRFESNSPVERYFKLINCPDEKYFQTIFADRDASPHEQGTTYAKWTGQRSPVAVSQSDLESARSLDEYWFARKFVSGRDEELLAWMDALPSHASPADQVQNSSQG